MIELRPYTEADREAVRDIAYQTGYMGESIDWQWHDKESWAQITSGYYTDREPESATVVDQDGQVVGYLLGCVDTENAPDPGLVGFKEVIRHGLFARKRNAAFVWRTVGDSVVDPIARGVKQSDLHFDDPNYPAHFHINLMPEVRGMGIGGQLVRGWLDNLKSQSVPGCHLETLTEGESSRAMNFFESQGFRRLGEAALFPGMRSRNGGRIRIQTMINEIE